MKFPFKAETIHGSPVNIVGVNTHSGHFVGHYEGSGVNRSWTKDGQSLCTADYADIILPMQIEVGKKYITDSGLIASVNVLSEFSGQRACPFFGHVTLASGEVFAVSWRPDGKYYEGGMQSKYDIVKEYKECEQ